MKIAIYADTFPPNAGGVSAAHEQLARLLEEENEVRRFAFNDSRPNEPAGIYRACGAGWRGLFLEWGLRTFIRRYDRGRVVCCASIARAVVGARRLRRRLRLFGPDILIVSDNHLPLLGWTPPPPSKVIWVAHHNYARFRNQPLVNGPCDYDCFLAHRLERRAVRKAHYAVFPSKYMERVFRETLGPSPGGRVIPNVFLSPPASPDSRSSMRARLGLSENQVLVYMPSGATDIKGSRYVPGIIQRLSCQYPGVAFYVSGPVSGETAWELSHMASAVRVITPGRLDYAENLRYVAACDLALSPALVENYSCALLEAQSLGLPCVSFDVGGNREILAEAESGYVVPYLDVNALCLAAESLLSSRPLLERLRQGALRRAAEISDVGRIKEAWRQVIATLASD